jgi:hypothetical protein
MKFSTTISTSVAAAALVACLAAPAFADPAVAPFYEAAMRIKPDGKLGHVVKQEEIKTAIPGARAWRIAYVSSDARDQPTIVTGVVVAPTAAAPAGGRPVIAWGHGTTGTAQNCGPSQLLDPVQELNEYFLVGGDAWTDYGLPSVAALLKAGNVVVATDYQGLGGGGRHQYAVATAQAHDMIDSVRAAKAMSETGAGRKAIIYGWSTGGGAAISAAGMGDYIARRGTAADGVDFVGFVALAPQDYAVLTGGRALDQALADKVMAGIVTDFSDNVFNFAHFTMSMWGNQAAYPNLKMTDLFTDEGTKVLDEIYSKKCMHAGADTISFNYGTGYKALLRPQPVNTLAWVQAIVDGSVLPVKPVAPVIIYWGSKDTTVPPVMGKLYQAQMCKLGGNVTRVQLPGEQSHFTTPGSAAPLYEAWIKDRLAGVPVADGCAGIVPAS